MAPWPDYLGIVNARFPQDPEREDKLLNWIPNLFFSDYGINPCEMCANVTHRVNALSQYSDLTIELQIVVNTDYFVT